MTSTLRRSTLVGTGTLPPAADPGFAATLVPHHSIPTDEYTAIAFEGYLQKTRGHSASIAGSRVSLVGHALRMAIPGAGDSTVERHFRLTPTTSIQPGAVVWWFSYHGSHEPGSRERWGTSVENILRISRLPPTAGDGNKGYGFMVGCESRSLELFAPSQAILDAWIRHLDLAKAATRRAIFLLSIAGAKQGEIVPLHVAAATAATTTTTPSTVSRMIGSVTSTAVPRGGGTVNRSATSLALSTAERARSVSMAPDTIDNEREGSFSRNSAMRRSMSAQQPMHLSQMSTRSSAPHTDSRIAATAIVHDARALSRTASGITSALEATLRELRSLAQDDGEPSNIDATTITIVDPAALGIAPPPIQRTFTPPPQSPSHPPLPARLSARGQSPLSASTTLPELTSVGNTPPVAAVAPVADRPRSVSLTTPTAGHRRGSDESEVTLFRGVVGAQATQPSHGTSVAGAVMEVDRYACLPSSPQPRPAAAESSPTKSTAATTFATARGLSKQPPLVPTEPPSTKTGSANPTPRASRPMSMALSGLDWNVADMFKLDDAKSDKTSPRQAGV
ncbi:hypothetical protein BC828DRAFT_383231 [Blastocladiella britannica]|nr:hypothetical protein BC828DRAFT_383231 [Blastocladiella britannica]